MPADQRTIKLGYNVPGDRRARILHSVYRNCEANWWKRNAFPTKFVTITLDWRPITTNGTEADPNTWSLSTPDGNLVDNLTGDSPTLPQVAGFNPTEVGTWTLIADDLNPSSPMNVALTSNGAANITIANSGGPGTPSTPSTSANGVTSITLTSGGSGYTDYPTVKIVGNGTVAVAYPLICNGARVRCLSLGSRPRVIPDR